MSPEQKIESKGDWAPDPTAVHELSEVLSIKPEVMQQALISAYEAYQAGQQYDLPANKKKLFTVKNNLARAVDGLRDQAVQERLIEAVSAVHKNKTEIEQYAAWYEARDNVENALEAMMAALELLERGCEYDLAPGRHAYIYWELPVRELIDVWGRELGKKVTISAHPADRTRKRQSDAVRFVFECMRLIDPAVTEQACRNVMINLQKRKTYFQQWDDPENID